MADACIAKEAQAIVALVGFLEHHAELRFEFRVRAAAPRGAIVNPDTMCGSSQLSRQLASFVGLGQLSAEADAG